MLLSLFILLLYFSVFIVTAISISKLYKYRHLLGYRALVIALLGHCFVAAAALVVFAVEPLELKILFSRLRFLGFSIISPSIAIFINSLYVRWKWLEKKSVIALLYLPVALTWTLTITPSLRDHMVTQFEPIKVGLFQVVQFKAGGWFFVHFLTSYAFTFFMLTLGAVALFKESRTKRMQILVFWLSILFVSAVDTYSVLFGPVWRWSMLPGAIFVIADVAILYAGVRHKLFEVVPYATEKIFQSLSDPILVVDEEGKLETSNRAATELFDLNKNGTNRDLQSVLHEARQGEEKEKEKERGRGRLQIKFRHFDVVSEPIAGEWGRLAGRIIYLREITAWMELEQSLNSHLDLKSTMLSLISHDVVGSLYAQATLLKNMSSHQDEKTRALIEVLVSSHETMHQFLRNVLNWEKLHKQRFVLTRTPFDLRLLVAQSIEVVNLLASIRSVCIETEFDLMDGSIVDCDSELLASAIRNILANAIKASPAQGRVKLRTRTSEASLEISVTDEGPGLSDELIRKLLDQSVLSMGPLQTGNGGFGLGLSITKYLIRMHAGEFWIESIKGQGARVGFSIPLLGD